MLDRPLLIPCLWPFTNQIIELNFGDIGLSGWGGGGQNHIIKNLNHRLQSTYLYKRSVYLPTQLERIHCNFTGDGKCNERGWTILTRPGYFYPHDWMFARKQTLLLCVLCDLNHDTKIYMCTFSKSEKRMCIGAISIAYDDIVRSEIPWFLIRCLKVNTAYAAPRISK